MIQVDALTRNYGDFIAVDQVSFEIGQGEIVGLLGHNGAGKTTILKMLTGFLEPTAGAIKIDGLDIREQREAIQRRIGYLPENCPLYPEMTVIDYLDYAASLHGVPESDRNAMIREAIVSTELQPKAVERISTLSRGYQQRVGVAQAIMHKPKILILDEPTNGLDPGQIRQMRSLIKGLAQKATVILSTHILQEVQAVCDRVIIIRNGCKALDSHLDELRYGNRLIISTDANPEQAKSMLDTIQEIGSLEVLEENEERCRYALVIHGDGDPIRVAPDVARTIIEHGSRLFFLAPETRDLETIFGEISAQEVRSVP